MAQLAGTTDTYDLKGQREDLMNKIFMITPEDTPFMSNIGRNRGSAVRHEWQTDVLAAPDTSNAQIEGDEYVYADRSPTVRVGNLMQISRKPVNISRTLEVVDKAGRQSEVAYQVAKAGKELKKDMEAILLANQASVVGNNSTARKLGGFAAWLVTNVSRGASAVAGGYNVGTGLVVAYTPGTARAFTETILKTVQQAVYTAGGNPKIIMMAVGQKSVFSSFTGLAQTRLMPTGGGASQATIVGAADTYVGDFGTLTTVVNRVQQAGTAFLVDTSMVSLTTLRPIKADQPAQTGDALKRMLIVEYTLTVNNEAAQGGIFDLT
jgi:hypothetical protein